MASEITSRTATSLPPQVVLREMVTGHWKAQSLYVAARLGIADLLKDGPQTVQQLAEKTRTHSPSLFRLLRALASVGVFAADSSGRFGLTPLASCLVSDIPNSQRAAAIMMGEEHYNSWKEALYSVQTGKPAFDHVYGQPVFDYLRSHPESAQVFDAAMTAVHGRETGAMLAAYDFGAFRVLVDVGGGNGTMLCAVLEKYPSLEGLLYDQDDVIKRAQSVIKAQRMQDRCKTIAGNFFQSIPPGGDAYVMRHIIHDWNDEQARVILGNCRRAFKPGARLLLVETVLSPGNDAGFGKWLDVNMLLVTGGMERTEEEYGRLFSETGFKLTRIVPTHQEVSVIEGEPV